MSAVAFWAFRSHSGAFLPNVQYRLGRFSAREMGITQFSAFAEDNLSDTVYVENGVSPVRELDGFFARVRNTF